MPGPSDASGRLGVEVVARTTAPVEVVWDLVATAARWTEWSFVTRSVLEREGSPGPDGVGALRRLTVAGRGSREAVVAFEPPHHLGYTIVSGFPVRNHRADVVLEPSDPGEGAATGAGTVVRWTATFDPAVPGTGRATALLMRAVLGRLARALTRYADATGSPPAGPGGTGRSAGA
ncbi:MAG: SRPBCC family protein [Actinomycetota bacterium]|nr:SRPBCC family protein [Actinomycetota bacterium]